MNPRVPPREEWREVGRSKIVKSRGENEEVPVLVTQQPDDFWIVAEFCVFVETPVARWLPLERE